MANKVPPPILAALAIGAVWAIDRFSPFTPLSAPFLKPLAIVVAGLGVAIVLYSGLLFKRAKTTVNPFRPNKTSAIVDTGIYAITRNPMYLGMAMVIAGAVIWSGQILGLAPLLIFIIHITRSQIMPEEVVLEQKFGQPYLDYKSRVRRWL